MIRPVLVLVLVLTAILAVAGAAADDRVVETRTITDTLSPSDPAGTLTVVVDNIFGSIRVQGHDRPVVEFSARETVRARDQAAFERAREEVTLDVRNEDGEIELYVDGPFRCNENCRCGDRGSRHYTVLFDFELKVPRQTDLELKTVNEGEIRVEDVHGRYDVNNVNGGVELNRIAGSGSATTVNGPVTIVFDGNPDDASSFKTINGKLDLSFQPDLSADLRFKTFNGEVWTDFDSLPLPSDAPVEELHDGWKVIRAGAWSGVRVAGGGPRLTFETLNGDILIRNALR
jgi:hypothetical protein